MTTTILTRRLDHLATLTESTVLAAIPALMVQPCEFAPAIADELSEGAKAFVFALRDAIGVLTPRGGDA